MPFPNRNPSFGSAPAAQPPAQQPPSAEHDGGDLDWNSEISPGKEFALFPEGVISFEVLALKKDRRAFGALGTCHAADLVLLAETPEGHSDKIEETLTLHSKLEWKLYQFFTAIGQRQHGENTPFRPDWSRVSGAKGFALIKHRKYIKRDQTEGVAHGVEKWLTEEEAMKILRDQGRA